MVGDEESSAARQEIEGMTLPMRNHPDAGPAWGCRPEGSSDELCQQAISSAGSDQACRHCHDLFCNAAAGGGTSTLVHHEAHCEEVLVLLPPRLSQTMYQLNDFSKVNSLTNPSTQSYIQE